MDILARDWELDAVIVKQHTSRKDAINIPGERRRVHRHHNFITFTTGKVTLFIQSDGVPGGLTLDI